MLALVRLLALAAPPPQLTTACTEDDGAVWKAKGQSNFESDMSSCGKSCLGRASCAKSCIEKAEGYSEGCASCFGDLVGCTSSKCWTKCIAGETAACKQCVAANCDGAFTACSGFTPPGPSFATSAASSLVEHASERERVGLGVSANCTGSGEFPSFRPLCYTGSQTVQGGIEVSVDVRVTQYSDGKGTMDVVASEFQKCTCNDHSFTKSGQSIGIDLSDCVSGVSVIEALYCSDDNSMSISVKGSMLPDPMTMPLKHTACKWTS
mmetsp:Transcript_20444/g.46823  ORF Transcript_20444/g.46823 Transcript_20444/m.46823 type:complete len:265 (+) Transcript_20444:28-822(+)